MSEAPEVLRFYDDELSRTLEFMTRCGNNKYVRADRIEELEAELEYWKKDSADAWDKCEENRLKLAKAVKALGKLADCVDDGCFCSEMEMATAMDTARTTLAELSSVSCANLKGQDDE